MQKVKRRVAIIVTVMKLSTQPSSTSTIKNSEYKYKIFSNYSFLIFFTYCNNIAVIPCTHCYTSPIKMQCSSNTEEAKDYLAIFTFVPFHNNSMCFAKIACL